MTIRVVLADDQALIRSGFRVLIDSAEDLEVVGEAGTGDDAVRLARSTRADVVLMDIRMPGTDGIAAMRSAPLPAETPSSRPRPPKRSSPNSPPPTPVPRSQPTRSRT